MGKHPNSGESHETLKDMSEAHEEQPGEDPVDGDEKDVERDEAGMSKGAVQKH